MTYGEKVPNAVTIHWYWYPDDVVLWSEDFEAILDQQWAIRMGWA